MCKILSMYPKKLHNYFRNWQLHIFFLTFDYSIDWSKIDKVRQVDLDTPLPKKAILDASIDNQISDNKRRKNVYIPDGPGLEIVPYLEGDMVSNQKDLKLPEQLLSYIQQTRQQTGRKIRSRSLFIFFWENLNFSKKLIPLYVYWQKGYV